MIQINGDDKRCSGCGSCRSICPKDAISMREDRQGFLRPFVNEAFCIECGLCNQVCPIGDSYLTVSNKKSAVALKKKKGRMESQSGGAFAVLAEEILSAGGIVYGVEMQELTARYTRICSLENLNQIKGSKYVQAEPGTVFRDVEKDLRQGKEVLFSGTACHVDGLLHFLKKKEIDVKRLYTVDLVCEGVVSPSIFREYIKNCEKQYGRVSNFNFRDKQIVPWGDHVTSLMAGGKKVVSRKYVDIFYSRLCLRPSCHHCVYASMDRPADITLGDYWGVGKYHSKFADTKGVSLVLLNTKKGGKLFKKAGHRADYIKTPIAECVERQPYLRGGEGAIEEYENFWEDFHNKGFLEAVQKYCNYNGTTDYEWTIRRTVKKQMFDLIRFFYKKMPAPLKNIYRMLRDGRREMK